MNSLDKIQEAIEAAELLQKHGLGQSVEDDLFEEARDTLSQYQGLLINGEVLLNKETNRAILLYGGVVTNKSTIATMMAGFQIDHDNRVGTMVVRECQTPIFSKNMDTQWELIGDETISAYFVDRRLIVGADVTTFDNLIIRGYLHGVVAYDTTPQTGYFEIEAMIYFQKVEDLEENELFRWHWKDCAELPLNTDNDDDDYLEIEHPTLNIELENGRLYTDEEIIEIVEMIEEECSGG